MVHKSDYVTANGVPIVNPANIVNGTISSKNIMYISKDKSIELERYKLEVNDIVLARRGDLTKCTIVGNEQVDFICGTGSFFLHLISVLPQYFQLVYMSSYMQIILTTECIGATMNNLNQSVLSQILFPLPPLAEQKRLVARTKYMLSIITTLDNEQYSLHTTIKQAKAKVLDLAIHGKLVSQDPNDEPASELLKRINPKAEIITDNGHYQKLPVGWCVCHINEISESLLGKTLDRTKDNGEFKRYVCAVNVQWGYFDFTTQKKFRIEAKDFERYAVKRGDLLICEGGDVGRCAIWDTDTEMYYQNALHRVRCKFGISEKYLQYSLWHFKLNGVIDSLCKGVTIKHFTQSTMNKLEIPLPPFAEQQRIVAKIEELFHQLDIIEESL